MTEPDEPGRPRATERTFDESLLALEKCVRRIDAGDLPLEEALKVFEEGVALVQECHEKLDAAERRITELVDAQDGVKERPFPA